MMFNSPILCKLETHVTLDATNGDRFPLAVNWAVEQGLKWTHIELAAGLHPSQPMMTFWRTGTLKQSLGMAEAISAAMDGLQLHVVRVKVECESVDAARFFENSTQLAEHPGYFEHHIKLQLNGDAALPSLTELALRHDARLSSNARRTFGDGRFERFVTQRAYQSDGAAAAERLALLVDALRTASFPILEVEEEYVLYDSHLKLDAGWL